MLSLEIRMLFISVENNFVPGKIAKCFGCVAMIRQMAWRCAPRSIRGVPLQGPARSLWTSKIQCRPNQAGPGSQGPPFGNGLPCSLVADLETYKAFSLDWTRVEWNHTQLANAPNDPLFGQYAIHIDSTNDNKQQSWQNRSNGQRHHTERVLRGELFWWTRTLAKCAIGKTAVHDVNCIMWCPGCEVTVSVVVNVKMVHFISKCLCWSWHLTSIIALIFLGMIIGYRSCRHFSSCNP